MHRVCKIRLDMDDLLKQIRKLNKKKLDNIELDYGDDLTEIRVHLKVEEGIHMGGEYVFLIKLFDDFLESRPVITCESDIYHPNIEQDREVCCNLFKDDWEDGTTLEGIIAALYCLLENPNFESKLNTSVVEDGYAEEVCRRLENPEPKTRIDSSDSDSY